MPRCGCTGTCSCLVVAGEGVIVEGIGSVENPYEISSDAADLVSRIEFTDTSTIDFTASGLGSGASPMVVSAVARVGTDELTDVQGDPSNNQVLVWSNDHWEPQDLPVALPPGGTTGQVLAKVDDTDGNADWTNPAATAFQVQDTPTLDLSLTGVGSTAAPYVLSGTVLGGSGGGGGGLISSPVIKAIYQRLAASSAPVGTMVDVVWDYAEQTAQGISYNATTGRFTVLSTGLYLITTRLRFTTSGTVPANAWIGLRLLNDAGGAFIDFVHEAVNAGATGQQTVQLSRQVWLTNGTVFYVGYKPEVGSGWTATLATTTNNTNAIEVSRLDDDRVENPGLAQPTYASARGTATGQSIPSGPGTRIVWEVATADDGIPYDTTNNQWVIPVSGWYDIVGSIQFATNATGYRLLAIVVNGSAVATVSNLAGSAAGPSALVSKSLKLNAGDIVQFNATQNTGANLALSASAVYNYATITKVPSGVVGGVITEGIYAASRRHTANLSIPDNTLTPVPFDTEDFPGTIPWNAATNDFTIPVDGYYQVNAKTEYNNNGTGLRQCRIMVNAASTMGGIFNNATSTAGGVGPVAARLLKLSAGDKVSISTMQTSGAALTLAGAGYVSVDITKVPQTQSGATGPVIVGEKPYTSSRAHVAATSFTTGTVTAVPFDTSTYEDGISFDGSAFVIPATGYYTVLANVTFAPNAAGARSVYIHVNGVNSGAAGTDASSAGARIGRTLKLTAGDLVSIRAQQSSGANLTLSGGGGYNWVSITKVPGPTVYGLEMSGTWGSAPLDAPTYGTDSLIGREIYLDSNGRLRAKPDQISGLIADRPVTALCTAYPQGTSVMYVSAADGVTWPTGQSSVVTTVKTSNNAAIQWCAVPGSLTKVWVRNGYSAAWGPWVQVADSSMPKDCAAEIALCTDTVSTPNPGSRIDRARYNKVGKTVTFWGHGLMGTSAVANGAILLPPSAGTPAYAVSGPPLGQIAPGGSPDVLGSTFIHNSLTRLITCSNSTTAYYDFLANTNVYWNFTYEVTA